MEHKIKKEYSSPEIECTQLDNTISLQLESVPPFGPGEISENVFREIYVHDPFKA